MKMQEIIQDKRKQHLKQICQQYHNAPPDPYKIANTAVDMMVDDKHKIVMCCTAKIAGTSWKRVFNVLTGISSNSSVMNMPGFESNILARNISRIQDYKPDEVKNILNNYTKVMFARHPLTRILSAFKNKLAPNSTDERNRYGFRQLVGYEMIKKYRPWSPALKHVIFNLDKGDHTVPVALRDYDLIDYDLNLHDFIKFLIDDDNSQSHWNNHWMENYRYCRPCDVTYDVIGKYETLSDDARYLLKRTKVDDIVSFPKSEGNAITSTHSSDHEGLITAYKQIPFQDIDKIVKRYKMDFLLFNYSLPSVYTGIAQWFDFSD